MESPIPDPVTLLKEIRANQIKLEEIRENYTFHELIRTDTLDRNDAVKESTSTESEVFFVNGKRIRRLVKKDGAELSPRDREHEQNRVMKEIGSDLKAGPGQRQGRGGGGRNGFILEVLAVAKISNARRISFRGRPTVTFDFVGDPHASSHGAEQNAGKKMAGTLWIDDADRQVARLEVHFYENFRMAGGLLVSVQKGTGVIVDQSPLGDGLWMQTAQEIHLAARVVVKSLHENLHTQDFDFKKFDIGTVQKINSPRTQ